MGYKHSNYRKKYKKRKGKGKVPQLTNKQARTSAYDSRIEKVMARVARKEDLKQQERYQYRQYLFGAYDINTNRFGIGSNLHFDGFVQAVARVQKMDASTLAAIPPAAQPFQTPATWQPPGANVVAATAESGMNGFRLNNRIIINGISFSLRALTEKLLPGVIPEYEHAHIYWKLCATFYEGSEAVNSKPDPADLLSIPRFGYSKKLDFTEDLISSTKRVRVFGSGKLKIKCSSLNSNVLFFNTYVSLAKKPLEVHYDNLDQNGAQVIKWKPFLVLRSNIPQAAALSIYMPRVWATTKIHYTS